MRVTVRINARTLLGAPNLFVLALGVNTYREKNYKLDYAVPDAETFGAEIAKAGAGFYRSKPEVTVLRNGEINAQNLARVFAEIGARVKATDVFVLYLAGHGKTVGGKYYFLPAAMD